ncbi:hypothetical protein DIPPA_34037 [Diplonema papillatum]|nr:hypothetical protein DIPPA_34037 [Diplonema papillatum]
MALLAGDGVRTVREIQVAPGDGPAFTVYQNCVGVATGPADRKARTLPVLVNGRSFAASAYK